jgi:hypothetical protein
VISPVDSTTGSSAHPGWGLAPALAAGLGIVLLGLWSGGYGPTAWGWSALAGLWACAVRLGWPGRCEVGRLPAVLLVLLAALSMWTATSIVWSFSRPETAHEAARTLVYLGFVGALVLLLRPSMRDALLVCVSAAVSVIVVVALAIYFLRVRAPDPTQGSLLFRPVGYANALGGLAAIPLPLLLATATRDNGRHDPLRTAAAAALVPFAAAVYLTQSRAAVLATAVGIAYWLVRARPGPLASRLVGSIVAPALTVAALAALDLTRTADGDAGRGTRQAIGALAVVAGSALAAFAPGRSRLLHGLDRRRAGKRVIAAAGAAVAAAGLAQLVTSGIGDRAAYWQVAWRTFVARPIHGAGAGSFAAKWIQLRTVDRGVLDAHNLYLETLAELGLVGALLLVSALALPIVGARRSREPVTVAAVGSYSVYLVHAAFEWDWEMPVVTLAALAIGAAIVIDASHRPPAVLGRLPRVLSLAAAATAIAFAFVSLVGQTEVTSAERQSAQGDGAGAATGARRAARLLPWASAPWLVLGDLDLRARDTAGARRAYRTAAHRDPNDWQIWLRLSLVTVGHEADRARDRALRLNPRLAGAPS